MSEPVDHDKWVRLPDDTKEQCDALPPIDDLGPPSSREDAANKLRAMAARFDQPCRVKAAFIYNGTCGCGAVHMKQTRCWEHRVADLEEDVRTEKRYKRKLIAALRRADPSLDSDMLALYTALGISVTPKPKAHPIQED